MATKILQCRIDRELDRAIEHFRAHARLPPGHPFGGRPLTRSQAVREILRQALTSATPPDRGWHEGFLAGYAEAEKARQTAMSAPAPGYQPPGAGARKSPKPR